MSQPLGNFESSGFGCFGEQDPEFIPPIPGEDINIADILLATLGYCPHGFITDEMALGIVDLLEIVEIEHNGRKRFMVTSGI